MGGLMAITQKYSKAPAEVLDYLINWATWLDSDTISSSSWSADTGLTVDSDSNTTTSATVWLSGGVLGTTLVVTNTIITVAGRTRVASFKIIIGER